MCTKIIEKNVQRLHILTFELDSWSEFFGDQPLCTANVIQPAGMWYESKYNSFT